MGLFSRKKQTLQAEPEVKVVKQSYSTPFLKIGKGDLTKPYISEYNIGSNGYVRFGVDNMYPQIINQLYYTSPLNACIIEYKTNSIIGGSFEVQNVPNNVKKQSDLKYFLKKNKLKKQEISITKDLVMHSAVYVMIYFEDFKPVKFERLKPEKIRLNKEKTKAYFSDDWLKQTGIEIIPVYCENKKFSSRAVYVFHEDTPGQDYYPLSLYSSAANWMYLDGESSLLHKSNIEESIFPSMVISRPKNFNTDEEAEEFRDSLKKKKGVDDAGFIWVLTADNPNFLPKIDTIQTSGNDKLFLQTDERMDACIARAHQIDPLLLGIRVSSKLGSGAELPQAQLIFEKTYVLPKRAMVEEIINDLFLIFNIEGDYVINNYQIVDGVIEDKTEDVTKDEEIVTEVDLSGLRGLSASENSDIYRIIRDYSKGRLNEVIATTRLKSYGIDDDTIVQILKQN